MNSLQSITSVALKNGDSSLLIVAMERKLIVIMFQLLFRNGSPILSHALEGGGCLVKDFLSILDIIRAYALRGSDSIARNLKRSLKTIHRLKSTGKYQNAPPQGIKLAEKWHTIFKTFTMLVETHAEFLLSAGGGCSVVGYIFHTVFLQDLT
jgi:hypothetical protein